MADSSISIKDAADVTVPVDTFTIGTDHRQAIVVGDAVTATTAAVTAAGLAVAPAASSAAARTSVTAATADTALLAANTARFGFSVFNDSTATLYLSLGSAAATTTDYTVQISAGSYFEAPYGYRGAVRGIWSAANGAARITEMT